MRGCDMQRGSVGEHKGVRGSAMVRGKVLGYERGNLVREGLRGGAIYCNEVRWVEIN